MSRLRLADVRLDGRPVDIDVIDGVLAAIRERGSGPGRGFDVLGGNGGAVLPGLHDHHVHLLATAAIDDSVACGPETVSDERVLQERLRGAPSHPDGWVRGVGYHESVAGDLDRHTLDSWVPDRPVRIQHRGGALWYLNSAALDALGPVLHAPAGGGRHREGVETDGSGLPTGRLWRLDGVVSEAVPRRPPDLASLGRRLRTLGITGVTDATPDLPSATVQFLADATQRGELPLRVMLLGAADVPAPLLAGPAKILLPDHALPDFDDFVSIVRRHRRADRAVAVHCVTRESLLLTLAVLDEVGARSGDRIEHGAVVPRDVDSLIADAGLTVVTQPDFLRSRGETYRSEVVPDDVDLLYRHASLLASGVRVTPSSDAPYGDLDPWRVITSAVGRRTSAGTVLGPGERVSPLTALNGYLSPAGGPGGPPRRLAEGERTSSCSTPAWRRSLRSRAPSGSD